MTTQEPHAEPTEAQRKAIIQQTFNTVADCYGTGGCRFFHHAGEFMANLPELQGNEYLLDVASGTGALTIPLAHRVPQGRVRAIDFSTNMLQVARNRAQEEGLNNIQFQVADMTALPLEPHAFDHAFSSFSLFFVEDMVGTLRQIASKVKPGGTVTVSGFTGHSFMPLVLLALNRLRNYGVAIPDQPFGWRRLAEPEQLEALFEEAGLRDITIERRSLGYHVRPGEWWDVVWNAGFRNLVAQVGDRLEEYRREHIEEVSALAGPDGVWLEIDVNFTTGRCETA